MAREARCLTRSSGFVSGAYMWHWAMSCGLFLPFRLNISVSKCVRKTCVALGASQIDVYMSHRIEEKRYGIRNIWPVNCCFVCTYITNIQVCMELDGMWFDLAWFNLVLSNGTQRKLASLSVGD